MDVFNADQSRYLGTVIRVWQAPAPAEVGSGEARAAEHGHTPDSAQLEQEEGGKVSTNEHLGSRQLGEEMGPFPTIAAGNTGPVSQSAAHQYATERDNPLGNVIRFSVRPGRINLGPLTRPFNIPASAVRSISMERVIVDLEA